MIVNECALVTLSILKTSEICDIKYRLKGVTPTEDSLSDLSNENKEWHIGGVRRKAIIFITK